MKTQLQNANSKINILCAVQHFVRRSITQAMIFFAFHKIFPDIFGWLTENNKRYDAQLVWSAVFHIFLCERRKHETWFLKRSFDFLSNCTWFERVEEHEIGAIRTYRKSSITQPFVCFNSFKFVHMHFCVRMRNKPWQLKIFQMCEENSQIACLKCGLQIKHPHFNGTHHSERYKLPSVVLIFVRLGSFHSINFPRRMLHLLDV